MTNRMTSTQSDIFKVGKDIRNGQWFRLEECLLAVLGILFGKYRVK